MQRHLISHICLLLAVILAAACNAGSNSENSAEADSGAVLEVEANREGVFSIQDQQSEALPVAESLTLKTGQGVAVDQAGRATVRLPGLLTAELSSGGELTLERVSSTDQSLEVTIRQIGGLLLADFNPNQTRQRRLNLQLESGTLTTTGSQFLLVQEADSSLTWIINLGEVGTEIQVTGADGSSRISPDTARWLAPDGTVSAEIPADQKRLRGWYNSIQNDESELSLAEVLLSPANLIGTTGELPSLPRLGQPFALAQSEQGSVKLTLDLVGLFGRPRYALEDCNGDGSQDIAIQAGKVLFDFRSLLARTLALDVTVLNRARAGEGALAGQDLRGREIDRAILEAGNGKGQTLNLRASQPFYMAELAILDGCLMGFSLTPPTAAGTPPEPRSAVTPEPVDAVVNILATPEQSASTSAPLEAVPVESGTIQIDGQLDDWQQSDLAWIPINSVVYDQGCINRYPNSTRSIDLTGRVRLAYDDQNLYVAFQVEDDGFVGYAGNGETYFLGDSPQLSLDMDLNGDINDPNRTSDDWQVDFLPEPESPRVALWQLGSLSSRPFTEAQMAVTLTETGYLLEAALPWRSFNLSPRPGDRLGLAANLNDNDTPGSNTQECILSTAPQRQWDNPTTWGTLFLRPTE